jgi:hypothetical protein
MLRVISAVAAATRDRDAKRSGDVEQRGQGPTSMQRAAGVAAANAGEGGESNGASLVLGSVYLERHRTEVRPLWRTVGSAFHFFSRAACGAGQGLSL